MNKKILPSPEAGNKKDFLDPDTIFIKVFGKKYISRFYHPAFSRSQTIDQFLCTLTRFKKGNFTILRSSKGVISKYVKIFWTVVLRCGEVLDLNFTTLLVK